MWNEIARTGTWTAMGGQSVTLTADDLDTLVTSFDPADPDGAPLVFGHPRTDDPAYGWVAGLRRDGDKLLAQFRDVPEAVREMVANGRYRNVSVKLSPDKGRLVHVGLLGAVPPAISGLKPVAFQAGDAGLTIEFSEGDDDMTELEKLQAENASLKAQLASGESAARAKELEGELATAKDATAKAEAKAVEAEKAFAAYKDEQADKAREARFDALVKADKATPGEKTKVLAFAKSLSAGAEIEFAAADGQTTKISQEEAYWRDLEARQPQGMHHEFSAPPTDGRPGETTIPADLAKHV